MLRRTPPWTSRTARGAPPGVSASRPIRPARAGPIQRSPSPGRKRPQPWLTSGECPPARQGPGRNVRSPRSAGRRPRAARSSHPRTGRRSRRSPASSAVLGHPQLDHLGMEQSDQATGEMRVRVRTSWSAYAPPPAPPGLQHQHPSLALAAYGRTSNPVMPAPTMMASHRPSPPSRMEAGDSSTPASPRPGENLLASESSLQSLHFIDEVIKSTVAASKNRVRYVAAPTCMEQTNMVFQRAGEKARMTAVSGGR